MDLSPFLARPAARSSSPLPNDRLSKHFAGWPRGDEITIHHLLTSSAGFPNINSMPDYGTWQMFSQTPEILVEKFRDLPLEFEPGEQSVHSNSNYNVLALLIEKLSGRTYGEFLEDEIFTPLAMTHTALFGDVEMQQTPPVVGEDNEDEEDLEGRNLYRRVLIRQYGSSAGPPTRVAGSRNQPGVHRYPLRSIVKPNS